jgi:hypothetical protein
MADKKSGSKKSGTQGGRGKGSAVAEVRTGIPPMMRNESPKQSKKASKNSAKPAAVEDMRGGAAKKKGPQRG